MRKMLVSSICLVFFISCTTKKITKFYFEKSKTFDSIQESYQTQYNQQHFTIQFTDKTFNNISIEIFTDSLKYIYEFKVNEPGMNDTLIKYHLSPQGINKLVSQMALAHCTWINNLEYYEEEKKQNLIFMSIREKHFTFPFTNKKYYILTYFSQPQYYDSEGNLLDRRSRRRIRKINEDVFKRVTDKVAYTNSDRFR